MKKRPRSPVQNDETGNHRAKRATPHTAASSTTVHELSRLLDLTPLTSHANIHSRFALIAETLLTRFRLCVSASSKETNYEILEVEFYLRKAGCHEDPFTHGSDEQRRSGRWYFHRTPTRSTAHGSHQTVKGGVSTPAGGYRGGTRKGLDLTFGEPPDNAPATVSSRYFTSSENATTQAASSVPTETRGGVLLRTIRRVSDGKVISGPSLLVDEILRASGASSVVDLVQKKWENDTAAWPSTSSIASGGGGGGGGIKATLQLVPVPHNALQARPRVYSSPRVGLDLSHASIPVPSSKTRAESKVTLDHPRVVFISKPYRYFVHPHLLTANGRGHTCLGVYDHLQSATDASEGTTKARLIKETALKDATVVKYLEEYRKGVRCGQVGQIAEFIGSKGKGAGSAAMSALRMFGILRGASSEESNE